MNSKIFKKYELSTLEGQVMNNNGKGIEMNMSKTAAIRLAQSAVSKPIGRGTSWMLIGPYRADDIRGPSAQVDADSYYKARVIRTEWVAYIALVLMGYNREDAEYWTHELCWDKTTTDQLVDACITKMI